MKKQYITVIFTSLMLFFISVAKGCDYKEHIYPCLETFYEVSGTPEPVNSEEFYQQLENEDIYSIIQQASEHHRALCSYADRLKTGDVLQCIREGATQLTADCGEEISLELVRHDVVSYTETVQQFCRKECDNYDTRFENINLCAGDLEAEVDVILSKMAAGESTAENCTILQNIINCELDEVGKCLLLVIRLPRWGNSRSDLYDAQAACGITRYSFSNFDGCEDYRILQPRPEGCNDTNLGNISQAVVTKLSSGMSIASDCSSLQEGLDCLAEAVEHCEGHIQYMEWGLKSVVPYYQEATEACGTDFYFYKHHPDHSGEHDGSSRDGTDSASSYSQHTCSVVLILIVEVLFYIFSG